MKGEITMKNNKVKEFWNDHKVAILIAGGTIVSVASIAIGVKCKVKPKRLAESAAALAKIVDIPIPENFAVGTIAELWKEGDWVDAIVNDITTNDIGRLGQEFVKHGLVPEGAKVSMVLSFI